MAGEYAKPLPKITLDNKEFWDSCKEHAMRLQYCSDCDYWQYYPSPVCHNCDSMDLEWRSVSGAGSVYTHSVIYRPPSEHYANDVPYVYAIIELAEGPMMPSNVVGISPEKVEIGMPVVITYDDVTPDVTLPKFRPAPEA